MMVFPPETLSCEANSFNVIIFHHFSTRINNIFFIYVTENFKSMEIPIIK